jgi:hypothetical protein
MRRAPVRAPGFRVLSELALLLLALCGNAEARKLEELGREAAEIERMRAVLRSGLECNYLTLDECALLPERD